MPAPRSELEPARLDRAFALAARHVQSGEAGYAALAVGRGDGLSRIEAFDGGGRLDVVPRSPIASITKPITAVAVMQLVEAGALVLHEPLRTYLPEFRPKPTVDGEADEPITTWHLLAHASGLADLPLEWYAGEDATGAGAGGVGGPGGAPELARSPEDIVAALCTARPTFRPGSAYRYTTDTFHLLAAVISRLSGVPYRDYLAERVFGPLGMHRTSFDPDELGPSVPSKGAFGVPGMSEAQLRHVFRTLAIPGGGLWSTPDDVLRFGLAMLAASGGRAGAGARVLGRPFLELMLRRHTEGLLEVGTERSPNYGLGWGFPGLGRGTPSSEGSFGHAGATGSILLVDPEHDLVIVHLRNDWGATMRATDEVVQAVYGALS